MTLPDIPVEDWLDYQSRQFQQAVQSRIDAFNFEQAANQTIASGTASIQAAAQAGQDALQSALQLPEPAPPPAAPEPAPAPAPQPSEDLFANALNAASQAGVKNLQGFANQFSSTLSSGLGSGQDLMSGALGAVSQAGGNVQAFADSFSPTLPQLPSLPPPPIDQTPPVPQDLFGNALNAASQAGVSDLQGFADTFSNAVGSGFGSAQDLVQHGVDAVQSAGGDAMQFVQSFSPPELPPLPQLPQPAVVSQTSPPAPTPGPIDSSSPDAFARSFAPYAQVAAQQLGIDPAWVTAMAASESNYGKAPGNELFGIKALPGQASQSLATHEGEYGGTNVNQNFAAYGSPMDSVDAFVNLIQNHYKGAVGAQSLGDFVHGLKQGGYFTAAEPEYLGILQSISNRVGGAVQDALAGTQQAVSQAATTGQTAVNTLAQTAQAAAARTSQFALGLSSGDAMAFCGPAAALAFAETFGRNPTVEEAKQLAQQVGWNPAQGMAGPTSEVALLKNLGIDTHMSQGVDWSQVAQDASSGNPVIIDTPGHYFYVDGYNAQTGQFHLGTSATDLKASGGQEWFTPDQIPSLGMGSPRAAIFADHPLSAPGVAAAAAQVVSGAGPAIGQASGAVVQQAQDTLNAVLTTGAQTAQRASDSLDQLHQDLSSSLGQLPQAAQDQAQNILAPVLSAEAPSDQQATLAAGAPPPPPPGGGPQSPVDRLKSAFSDFVDSLGGAASSAGQAVTGAASGAGQQFSNLGSAVSTAAQTAPLEGGGYGAAPAGGTTPISAEDVLGPIFGTPQQPSGFSQQVLSGGPAGLLTAGERALGGVLAPSVNTLADALNPAIDNTPPLGRAARSLSQADLPLVSGVAGVVEPLLSAPGPLQSMDTIQQLSDKYGSGIGFPDRSLMTPEDQTALDNALLAIGGVSNPLAVQGGLQGVAGGAAGEARIASPSLDRLNAMFEGSPGPPPPNLGSRIQAALTAVNRQLFDRGIDLANLQDSYAKALGRPLNADEMVYELSRLASDPAAEVNVQQGLRPAVQAVGDDYTALRNLVTARNNVQVADALGNDARLFSGGLTRADSEQAIRDLQQQLGPDRFATVSDAADQVSQFSSDLRQRLVDSGVLSQQQAQEMASKYPDWVKTRILDYMDNAAGGGQAAGSKVGLSANDVHAYTQAGTVRAREDPIASMVAYAHQVERMARKNETFNALLNVDRATGTPQLRAVPADFSPTRNQVTIQGFVNGVKQKFVTDNRALGQAVTGANVTQMPEWTTAWQRIFRSLATSRNPVFLAGNAALDIPEYVLRSSIRAGGPQAIPRVLGELARGYADAFQGLLQGEYAGPATQRFLRGGGGQAGYFTGGEGISRQTVNELRRSNAFVIQSASDLVRLGKDLLTLKPVEALGERIELGPRVAAMRLAEQRGMNPVQAVIQGREVTVDFNQGGQFTKFVNQFVPFFNVGFQGPAQVARAFGDNRGAFVSTVGSLIGLPTVASEIWNNADRQRAQDYADVPQYLKDEGIVLMLPSEAPTDAQGNRHPQYVWINLRNWAPFATIARTAIDEAIGTNQQDWRDLAGSLWTGAQPMSSSGPADLMNRFGAGVPGLSAAAQLAMNRDVFRNRYIVSDRADQNASQFAKDVTPLLQSLADQVNPGSTVRPSAVDFALRDQLAGTGGSLLSAYDLMRGKPPASYTAGPQNIPVAGGLIGRFVRGQGGEQLQQAQQATLSPEIQQQLRQAGITYTPGPVGGSVQGVPLRQSEQTRYQQLANQYADQFVQRTLALPGWARLSTSAREQLVQQAAQLGHDRAGGEILRAIPAAERRQRLTQHSSAA